MIIFVMPSNKSELIKLDIKINQTVKQTKKQIIKACKLDEMLSDVQLDNFSNHSDFQLFFADKNLENHKKLKNYNISSETIIHEVGLFKIFPLAPNIQVNVSAKQEILPLIHKIELIVDNTPDKIAVISDEEEISYKNLNKSANQLAHFLLNSKLQNSIIGISGKSKLEMIICQLAIMKINSTFVILDVNDPAERVNFIVQDSEVSAIIHCDSESPPQLFTKKLEVTILEINKLSMDGKSEGNLDFLPKIANPAYLLYTSGSTANQPKGVIQTQDNICYQIKHYTVDMGITDSDRLLQLATLSHDQAIVDIYGALLNAATLVLTDIHSNTAKILDTIKSKKVTIFSSIPSMFEVLFKHEQKGQYPHLRIITIGGEETTLAHANLFQSIATHNDCKLINGYGATECSWISSFTISADDNLKKFNSFPLGQLTHGIEYLIDVEEYDVGGELLISGDGVSPGYWKNDEENRNSFVTYIHKKYYKTGDIVCVNKDKQLEFIGRAKWHEKIRGQRINLKEIQDIFNRVLSNTETIVLAIGEGMDKELVAFFAGDVNQLNERINIINEAIRCLPNYMVPTKILHIDAMPRLTNRKINRHTLKKLFSSQIIQLSSSESASKEENDSSNISEFINNAWKRILQFRDNNAETSNRNFIELGGNSLMAMMLINKIRTYCEKTLGTTLTLSIGEVYQSSLSDLITIVIDNIQQQNSLSSQETNTPEYSTKFLWEYHLDEKYRDTLIYTTDKYFAFVLNFESICILTDHYNAKYLINIKPCASYDDFIKEIVNAIHNLPKPTQIGLTFPNYNIKSSHPTPCILGIDKNNTVKLLVSDSFNSEGKVKAIKACFKRFDRSYPELTNVQFILDPYSRQLDENSCGVDAIVYLKNALRGNVLENSIVEDGVVIFSPPDALQTSQRNEFPENINMTQGFFHNPNKTLQTHQERYQKDILFFANTTTNGRPIPTRQLELNRNVFLYEKGKKFKKILEEKVKNKSMLAQDNPFGRTSSVLKKHDCRNQKCENSQEIRAQPKHSIIYSIP